MQTTLKTSLKTKELVFLNRILILKNQLYCCSLKNLIPTVPTPGILTQEHLITCGMKNVFFKLDEEHISNITFDDLF